MIPPKLIALIVKELLSAFKDPKTRIAFIIPPLMQVFLYGYAATLEVTNVPIGVYNEDWGEASRQLIQRFERPSAFKEIVYLHSQDEVRDAIDSQRVPISVHIGQDFSRKLAARQQAPVQIILDGRRSNTAQILNGYVNTILTQFSIDYMLGEAQAAAVSNAVDRSWYNPNREYRIAMIPALVGTLTMTTVLFVIVMSVARERELGTFEQLLVSPLLPIEIIIGKAVPGLIIGVMVASAISLLVTQVFGIPLTGSIFVLYAGLIVFLLAIIGIALFISSLASTQQQAMLGAMVYMMPAIMLSGFTSPVQNMPDWLQPVALLNPLTHFLVIVRGVFLRDMPMELVAQRIWPMLIIAIFTLSAATWLFRRKIG
ncbi:MAG: ABC transporter permease [Rhodomicrobium sp.]